MRIRDCGAYVNVNVSADEVRAFKASWPCSGLPSRAIGFQFDKRNGDLVDVWGTREEHDGPALLALSHDAGNYAAKRLSLPEMVRR